MSRPISLLQREPYRLFFAEGVVLVWAGLSHWILHVAGWLDNFRLIFHAMAQVQGFIAVMVVGFLFTMLPRRTKSPPPGRITLALAFVCPIGTVISAWFSAWAIAQIFWSVFCVTLLIFIGRRVMGTLPKRPAPVCFVWLLAAPIVGIAGAVCAGVGASIDGDMWWLHMLGKSLTLQGFVLCMVIGAGGLAIPLMTRGEPPADRSRSQADVLATVLHIAGALLFVFTFWVEARWSAPIGFLLRGLVVGVGISVVSKNYRWPTAPGLHRKGIWLASWLCSLGFLLSAALPVTPKLGLHVVFIGGFSLLVWSVASQVVFGHGGVPERAKQNPVAVVVGGVLLLSSLVPRALMEIDRTRYFAWMLLAASLYLSATIAWLIGAGRPLFAAQPDPPDL